MNLPAKMDLKKTEVNIEETDQATDRIHKPAEKKTRDEATAAAKKAAERPPQPTKKMNPSPAERAAARTSSAPRRTVSEEPTTRVTIDIPASLYKGAKMKSFGEMITLKTYIVGLLQKDLKL